MPAGTRSFDSGWVNNGWKRARFIATLGLILVLAGCRSGSSSTVTTTVHSTIRSQTAASPTSMATTTSSTIPSATTVTHTDASCNPSPSQPWQGKPNGLPEIQGTADSGEFWALVEGKLPLAANDGIKIIWKMSGDVGGNLRLVAQDAQGNRLGPIWGPEAHMGSSWARLGNEWGAGFEFPHDGCWDVQATSGGNSGHIWFEVAESNTSSSATPAANSATVSALYPVPASCDVTPLSAPRADRWGFTAVWWTGTDLQAASLSSPLYASLGTAIQTSNEFRWELKQRAPLTITGHGLDQSDQSIRLTNDLSRSLSVVYPTYVVFPSAGCWQLHAEAGKQTLDFTVYVFPYACLPPNQRAPGSTGTCEPPQP